MERLRELINECIQSGSLHSAVFSQVRQQPEPGCTKVAAKPVKLREGVVLQLTYHYANKVAHENILMSEAVEKLMQLLTDHFQQALIRTTDGEHHILISKKYKVNIKSKTDKKSKQVDLSHNRKKQYIIEDGVPAAFLVELGIMSASGNVLGAKYDKFRQINRFIEMVEDVLDHLPADRPIRIIDFGCGKSYLTFALYHYLHVLRGREVHITGLDLKEDVIAHCEQLARTLQYDGLHFALGDIAQYQWAGNVDMVVTLHACDTATDMALEKAVRWGANVILSVPCCQHELYQQVDAPQLEPLLRHGILKERFSALATDAARAKLLDVVGYSTQLLEFIDLEHTPKNLLIRAVAAKRKQDEVADIWAEYQSYRQFLHIRPYLERALQSEWDRLGLSEGSS
ncbi:class I SAM-dependent methyltransferase [Paenibacillus agilis]|uniref:class I SAM-dependent methyltransferase n=1 Tax=Paenibacillus agilis TaxID=3020863 RepID=UPI0021BD5DBF|nr:SAM-dependent methyltransferase [Paenibacillus agilis]